MLLVYMINAYNIASVYVIILVLASDVVYCRKYLTYEARVKIR